MGQPSDPATGVKCFSIGGRMVERRQRCLGMTDEERRWRAQFLKDQILSPEEPKYVPEYYKETTNVFRRLWKTPFNNFQKFLEPILGRDGAFVVRHFVGKGLVTVAAGYVIVYFFKYHTNDFTIYRSVETWSTGKRRYPGDPDYPNFPEMKPTDYYDLGFYSSVLCQEVPIPPPPPPPPPATGVIQDEEDTKVVCVVDGQEEGKA